MNKNLDLVEILKDCPAGTKLYSTVHGEVVLESICIGTFPIVVSYLDEYNDKIEVDFMADGRYYDMPDAECVLFPSKDQRDWSKFNVSKPKFDPKMLQLFDKVLARIKYGMWYADFISLPIGKLNPVLCVMGDKDFDTIIPYNDDTKHLVGTTEEAPEYYRYWEN